MSIITIILAVLGITGTVISTYVVSKSAELLVMAIVKLLIIIAMAGGTWKVYKTFKDLKASAMRKKYKKAKDEDVPDDATVDEAVVHDLIAKALKVTVKDAGKTVSEVTKRVIDELRKKGVRIVPSEE